MTLQHCVRCGLELQQICFHQHRRFKQIFQTYITTEYFQNMEIVWTDPKAKDLIKSCYQQQLASLIQLPESLSWVRTPFLYFLMPDYQNFLVQHQQRWGLHEM